MSTDLRKTQFLKSAPDARHAPADKGAEVAFAGRSNAGKSSAINAITGLRRLARTSKTPGRTRELVFFTLDPRHRLVDLPGYGYARAAESVRRRWQAAVETYLNERRSLKGLILVMDVRHPLTDYDRQMLEWCAHSRATVHILLTKADKLSRGAAASALTRVRNKLKHFPGRCSLQLFSAAKGTGIEEARAVLLEWLDLAPEETPFDAGNGHKKTPVSNRGENGPG